MAYLEVVEKLDDPRQRGRGLTANHTGVWRYRVGDHHILAQIIDNSLTVLTLNVDHRKEVY